MANFMGPMAPPQAAPPQPAQLDIRTSPNQRAQFKSFMQGMSVPPTTAPIAPMLPAPMPSPMDQIDIFAPAPMADGGVVGGLNDLQQMSGQMVDALNTVVYGGGQGMGGGIGSVMQTPPGSLPSALPNIESGVYKQPMNTPMEMPSGFPFANSMTMPQAGGNMSGGEQMTGTMADYRQAQEDARRQRESGFMGRVVLPGEMSFEEFSIFQPQSDLLQQAQLYEDGGPVRMRRGGVTFESGRTYETGRGIGEQNREMDALERAAAMYEEDPGEGAGIDMGFPDPAPAPVPQDEDQYDAVVSSIDNILDKLNSGGGDDMVGSPDAYVPPAGDTGSTVAAFNPRSSRAADASRYQAMADYFLDDEGNIPALSRDAQSYIKETGTPAVASVAKPSITPDLGLGFGYMSKPLVEGSVIDFPFYSYPEPPITDSSADPNALSPAEELAIARGNPPTPGPYTGSGDSSVLLTGQDGDTTGEIYTPELQLANLANLRITGTGNEKIDGRSVVDDLNKRTAGADAGFSPAGILAKALGGGMATKIAKNVLSGDPDVFPVIDSSTNQIIGYSGEGGRGYTGRPGYNPLQAGLRGGGDRVRYDPATGAYFVDPLDPSAGSPDEQSDIVEMNRLRAAQEAVTPPPADVADPIVPPADPIVTPPLPPVVAPSPRDPVDITAPILTGGVPGIGPAGITAPILTGPNMGIDPLAPVGLPQSFLDLLTQLNRPAPRAMQDGGAVLDKAADDFLGALKSVA